MWKRLEIPRSTVLRPTPSWLSTGQLPEVFAGAGPTEAGFRNWNAFPIAEVTEAGAIWKVRCCGTPGMQSGRGASEKLQAPEQESRSQGIPVWKVKSELICQPPTKPSTILFMLFAN